MDLIARKLRTDEYELWDKLVEISPHGTIFHESFWLMACEELLNKELKIYGCFDNDKLIGGCSLYFHKSPFFKEASSIIAMSPYGGLVLTHSTSGEARERELRYNNILKTLSTILNTEHLNHIKLVNSPDIIDVRTFIWSGWDTKILYTYYLDLFNLNISKDARWTANKAVRNGIMVEKSEDINLFYKLFRETFHRQGLKPPVSEIFFQNLYNKLKSQNKGEMWIARTKSGEIAASEIIVYDNKRAYRWSAASHTELRKTGASSLLLFEIFQDLKKRRIKEINLMAANTPQLARFIASFNPFLVPYYAIEKSVTKYKLIINIYKTIRSLNAK